MKPLVLYHGGGCFDGFCSAWVFRLAFPDAEFRPINYGDPTPDVSGYTDGVFVVDFAFRPASEVVNLIHQTPGRRFVMLDHHETTKPVVAGLKAAGLESHMVFDQGKSGARLAWEFLWDKRLIPARIIEACGSDESAGRMTKYYTRDLPPWLVRYTEDRDLWLWKLFNSKEINAAIRSREMDFAAWDYLWQIGREGTGFLMAEGEAILRVEKQLVDRHVRHAVLVEMAGHMVPCVNATVLHSEIGHALCQGHPFSATYFDRLEAGQRVWSLRSAEGGVDVSEIAKRFGGGGHRAASGFQSPLTTPLPLVVGPAARSTAA